MKVGYAYAVAVLALGILGVFSLAVPVHAQVATPTVAPTIVPTPSPTPSVISDYERDVQEGKNELSKDKKDQELRSRVESTESFEADEETEPAEKVEADDQNDTETEVENEKENKTEDIQKSNSASDVQNDSDVEQ